MPKTFKRIIAERRGRLGQDGSPEQPVNEGGEDTMTSTSSVGPTVAAKDHGSEIQKEAGITELHSTPELMDRRKEEKKIGEDERKQALKKLKDRVGKKTESPLVVCVIGTPGSGKSSFINTMISSITGEYREWTKSGSHGGYGKQITHRQSIMPMAKYLKFEENDIKEYNFPTFLDLAGFENSDDVVTREILELVLYGRLPPNTKLSDVADEIRECGQLYVKRKYPPLETSRKVDRIFFVVSSTTRNLPSKLMNAVLSIASTKRDIPVFGVMTNKDQKEDKSKEDDFKSFLGLSSSRFFSCTNYCDDNLDDITNGKTPNHPYLDVPVLNFLCQALDPAIECLDFEERKMIDAEKGFFKLVTKLRVEIKKNIDFQPFDSIKLAVMLCIVAIVVFLAFI